MDLGTVKRRLENSYYWSALECIDDIKLVFENCYLYNKPGEDVVVMAQSLEKLFKEKLTEMPKIEIEFEINLGKSKKILRKKHQLAKEMR